MPAFCPCIIVYTANAFLWHLMSQWSAHKSVNTYVHTDRRSKGYVHTPGIRDAAVKHADYPAHAWCSVRLKTAYWGWRLDFHFTLMCRVKLYLHSHWHILARYWRSMRTRFSECRELCSYKDSRLWNEECHWPQVTEKTHDVADKVGQCGIYNWSQGAGL